MNEKQQSRITFGAVALISILLLFTLFSERGLLKARRLSLERDAIISKNQRLEIQNQTLMEEAHALKSDIKTIEKASRSQLDLVREDEILYKFSDPVD